jgi:hypothetical protein
VINFIVEEENYFLERKKQNRLKTNVNMETNFKVQKKARYFLYNLLCVVFWSLFIGGLYIMWYDNEMELFMSYIFSSFGLAGMLWFNMIFHDKFIENYT